MEPDDIEGYNCDSEFPDEIDYNVGSLDPDVSECDGTCMTTVGKSKISLNCIVLITVPQQHKNA